MKPQQWRAFFNLKRLLLGVLAFCLAILIVMIVLVRPLLSVMGSQSYEELAQAWQGKSSYQITVDSTVALRLWSVLNSKHNSSKGHLHKSGLLKKSLKYRVYRNEETLASKQWIYLVPGIFTTRHGPIAKYLVSALSDSGFNVVVVPNSFSYKYASAQPKYPPGHIASEAEIHCEILSSVKTTYRIHGKMKLFGFSYGGLLSPVIASICPEYIDQLTVVNPPIDLALSFEKISKEFDTVQFDFSREDFKSINEYTDYVQAKLLDKSLFRNLFLNYFHSRSLYAIYAYLEEGGVVEQMNNKPSFPKPEGDFQGWKLKMKGKKIFNSFFKSLFKQQAGQTAVVHWLNKSSEKVKIRIFISEDDPINGSHSYSQLDHLNEKIELIRRPSGGHTGFIPSAWFVKELVKGFQVGGH